ncbi:MAG: carbamate kinase [Desulfobacterales bacterium]|nr:carbamate kinase [Desulfobacterales bacterium]
MAQSEKGKPILLVALGGNALIQKGQRGTIEEQFDNLHLPMRQIAALAERYRLIITHGNGPQVGNLLLQQEACKNVPPLPLEILVAQTEGQIGYMIESTLDEVLMERGIEFRPLVTLITYVVVDKDDPSFHRPTKPIGPAYSRQEAARLPYPTIETPKGYRRVVASPEPVTIVERREIRQLLEMDFIVIACGGGGIPVIREGRAFSGVDAVIDKDLVSALLAEEVGADLFLSATDVPGVMLGFGEPDQKMLRELTVDEAVGYARNGHFGTGSMKPKVEAAVRFVRHTGKRAVIASVAEIEAGVSGTAGTQFVLEQSDT